MIWADQSLATREVLVTCDYHESLIGLENLVALPGWRYRAKMTRNH